MSTQTIFPPLPTWTAYTEAVQAFTDLLADLREAQGDLARLQSGADEAAAKDDAAQATALRSKAKDPGRMFTKAHADDLEATRTRVRVLTEAQAQQEAVVRALLAGQPDEAQKAAQDVMDAATEGYEKAVEGLLAARDTFWQATAVTGWVSAPTSRYKGGRAPVVLRDDRVIRNPFEERVEVMADRALDGFRSEIHPTQKRETARYVQKTTRDEIGGEVTKRFIGVDRQGRDYAGNQVVQPR